MRGLKDSKIKIVSGIIAMMMLLYIVFSTFFISLEANHKCEDEENCPMVESFSGGVCPFDDERYKGWFGETEYSGDYIREAMMDILKTELLAKEIQEKYNDKGIKVVFLDFNKGCEWGCAINVWIPEQQ